MKCNICTRETFLLGRGLILRKYEVSFYKCGSCGFVQTEKPYWLQESYAKVINRSDIGLVSRNIGLAKITRSIISRFFNADGKFIDFGGGYGLFVRLMRDYGFECYRFDKLCDNIFAQGFDADTPSDMRYELLTAFEVFEHLQDPIGELDQMLKLSDNVLFTTMLIPRNTPKPETWWYYGPDHGQHISFYSVPTLSFIAKRFSLRLLSDGTSIHLFTKDNISPLRFKLLIKAHHLTAFLEGLGGRKSLIPNDYQVITGKDLS
jgi:hypothetical protein